jgi:hypothetical protein
MVRKPLVTDLAKTRFVMILPRGDIEQAEESEDRKEHSGEQAQKAAR